MSSAFYGKFLFFAGCSRIQFAQHAVRHKLIRRAVNKQRWYAALFHLRKGAGLLKIIPVTHLGQHRCGVEHREPRNMQGIRLPLGENRNLAA